MWNWTNHDYIYEMAVMNNYSEHIYYTNNWWEIISELNSYVLISALIEYFVLWEFTLDGGKIENNIYTCVISF